MATNTRSRSGRKPGTKMQPTVPLDDRPYSEIPMRRPRNLPPAVVKKFDKLRESMPPDYFTAGDTDMVVMYCQLWVQRDDLLGDLALLGRVAENSRGDIVESAESKIEQQIGRRLAQLAKDLGVMMPVQRRMKTPAKKEQTPRERLLDVA